MPLAPLLRPWQASKMRIVVTLALSILMALPAVAETVLSGEAFDAYTRGKTLSFSANGEAYGAEEYRDDRRVRWSFLDGECKEGRWYDQGDAICFVYEDNPIAQCWKFFEGGNGLRAQFLGETGGALYETETSDEPLLCLGPDVGV